MERNVGALFLLTVTLIGCGGGGGGGGGTPPNNTSPNQDPPNNTQSIIESSNGGTSSHVDIRRGMNCLGCHQTGETSPVFTVAGTVFKTSNLTQVQPNIQVEFYSNATGTGTPVEVLEVDANGNFYTSESLNLTGLFPAVRSATEKRMMPLDFQGGQCNECHDGSPEVVINVN